jgi:hypothetical protein
MPRKGVGDPGRENRPVPAVDPADLKSVWATQDEISSALSRRQGHDCHRFLRELMQPGRRCPRNLSQSIDAENVADVKRIGGLISPWLYEGKPDNTVFKVVATATRRPKWRISGRCRGINSTIIIRKESEA